VPAPQNRTSRLSAKCRKNVRSVNPARSAISATVVFSNPRSPYRARAACSYLMAGADELGHDLAAAPLIGGAATRMASAQMTLSPASRSIRSSVVRLPPTVHGEGDHGFLATLVSIARHKGVSGYIGNGTNRWPAVHRLDAAHLFRLALEKTRAGSTLHAIADQGVPIRDIAEVIGRHLDLPVVAITPQDAGEHFAWLVGAITPQDAGEHFAWLVGAITPQDAGEHFAWLVVAITPQDAGEHFAWLVGVLAADSPALSALTLARLESYVDSLAHSPALSALRRGQSILVPQVSAEMLEVAAVDAEQLELLRRLGLASVITVPLRSRGRTMGILTLAGDSGRPPYSEADLMVVEELASRAAATVDNARSFAREHDTAETLARALLPGRLPQIPGLELSARDRPAGDVGGDFYDCFPTAKGGWMIVGDVCGRGAKVAVAVAGHPLPLLVRSDGHVSEVGRPGTLLGVLGEIDAAEEVVELGPGDALVLFTDGITERRRDRLFFADELAPILANAAGRSAMVLAQHIEDAALAFAAAAPDDDMAVLVLSVPVPAEDGHRDPMPDTAKFGGLRSSSGGWAKLGGEVGERR
jgi:GAF domain-containing protein